MEISLTVLLIIIGACLLASLLSICLICVYCRRRRKRSDRSNATVELAKTIDSLKLNKPADQSNKPDAILAILESVIPSSLDKRDTVLELEEPNEIAVQLDKLVTPLKLDEPNETAFKLNKSNSVLGLDVNNLDNNVAMTRINSWKKTAARAEQNGSNIGFGYKHDTFLELDKPDETAFKVNKSNSVLELDFNNLVYNVATARNNSRTEQNISNVGYKPDKKTAARAEQNSSNRGFGYKPDTFLELDELDESDESEEFESDESEESEPDESEESEPDESEGSEPDESNSVLGLYIENLDYNAALSRINSWRNKAAWAERNGSNTTFGSAKDMYIESARVMIELNERVNPRRPDIDADFHRIIAKEAKYLLPDLLHKKLEIDCQEDYIIDTGKGNHSRNGKGTLKLVVRKIIDDNGYDYRNIDDGIFQIFIN